jgi:hypothetical protein
LGEQASSISSRAFQQATMDGSVETFALVRPAQANKNAGIASPFLLLLFFFSISFFKLL